MSKRCLIPHERQKLERCLWCNKKINLSFKEKLEKQVDEISIETKQKVLDILHEGKTIGEACKATGLETVVVGEIIMRNIKEYRYLSREAHE